MIDLRALLVEDRDSDAKLIVRELRRGGFNPLTMRVDTPEAMHAALAQEPWDVILSDWSMPRFDALTAYSLLREQELDIPFIIVSGTVGEETAVAALKAGANDFMLKGKLSRLVPAIERELREAANRDARRQTEKLFHAVFEGSLDAMLIADNEARYVDGNPAALTLLGVDRADLVSLSVGDVVAGGADVSEAWAAFRREGRQAGELEVERKNGEKRRVEFSAVADIVPGRHLSVLRDVTDRRAAEEGQRRLAAIVESTDDAIVACTTEGTITDWNLGAERLYAAPASEMIGRVLTKVVRADRAGELGDLIARVVLGEHVRNFNTIWLDAQGSSVEVAMTLSPLRTSAGDVVGISVVARDMTEARSLQTRLAIADRMASIGTLAAGVAHEINNPLTYVRANVDLVAKELAHDDSLRGESIREALRQALEGIERIRVTVKDLKTFTRADEETISAVDVTKVLEASLAMAWTEVRHRAKVVKELAELPLVDANEAKLGQVFLNLLVNAAQAIPEGSVDENTLTMRTRATETEIIVEIQDSGVGIEPNAIPRLFDPFFTTKDIGDGTGLGLSLCHSIVTHAGGHIEVDSQVGAGSTFRVHLPRGRLLPILENEKPTPLARPRSARILLVDDEPLLVRVFTRSLPEHDVEGTSSPRDALERLAAGERYDVVFCDLMMPEMSGMELYQAVSEFAPEQAQRFVFLTGGAFTPRAREFLEQHPDRHADKPWDIAIINDFIQRMTKTD